MRVYTVNNTPQLAEYFNQSSEYYTAHIKFDKPYLVISTTQTPTYTVKPSSVPQGVLLSDSEYAALSLMPCDESRIAYLRALRSDYLKSLNKN